MQDAAASAVTDGNEAVRRGEGAAVADLGFCFRVCQPKNFIYNSVKPFANSVRNMNL